MSTENSNLELLKEALTKEENTWMAGSLFIGKHCFERTGVYKNFSFLKDQEKEEYSKEEAYLWAKIYVKEKTPNHYFYESSLDRVTYYEKEKKDERN